MHKQQQRHILHSNKHLLHLNFGLHTLKFDHEDLAHYAESPFKIRSSSYAQR